LIRVGFLLILVCCGLFTIVFPASTQDFDDTAAPALQIRNYPVDALNNSGTPYHFVLSVLGVDQAEGFLPLLAIAGRRTSGDDLEWLALWNLSDTSPSVWQRFRAALGVPGSPGGKKSSELSLENFPAPCLSVRSLRPRVWNRVRWRVVDETIRWSGYVSPARFFIRNYSGNGADLDECRFHQTYTLLDLYEAASQLAPSSEHFSASAIIEIKYHLLANRRVSCLFLDPEHPNEVVQRFESERRAQEGNTASYLHANANLYGLGLREINFGVSGKAPIFRAALLFIRSSSLERKVRDWPKRNPFDLAYNPFENPAVQELIKRHPDEEIPLAFYVLSSEYRLKPILVVDFFKRKGGIGREASRVWRFTLDQAIEMTNVPLLYRVLGRIGSYALNKKDYPHFSRRSAFAGVEPARLFARLEWTFDPDTNDLLLKALEKHRANPLMASYRREDQEARKRLEVLLQNDGVLLAGHLRCLFEDEVRAALALGKRALFDPDVARYEQEKDYREALRLVREFGADTNLPAHSWSAVLDAWAQIQSRNETACPDAKRFIERLKRIDPSLIPPRRQAAIRAILNGEVATLVASGSTLGDD